MFKNWDIDSDERKDFNGEIIEIPKSKDGYVRNGKIYGKSIQDGEPTHDNPVESKPVPSELDITSCGKNLLDIKKFQSSAYSTNTITNSTLRMTAPNDRYLFSNTDYYFYATAGSTYIWKGKYKYSRILSNPGGSYFRVRRLETSEEFGGSLLNWTSLDDRTFEYLIEIPTTGMYGFTLYPYNWNGNKDKLNIGDYAEFWDMQLERGSTATTYEPFTPYLGTTTPITLRDTDGNLHTPKSLPDGTRDEVDLDGGESVDRVKRLVVTSGTGVIYSSHNDTLARIRFLDTNNKWAGDEVLFFNLMCNIGSAVTKYSDVKPYECWYNKHRSYTNIRFLVPKLELASLDNTGAVAWVTNQIANHGNIIFDYPLAEPKPWTLHPDEQKKIITVDSDKAYIYTNAEVQPELSVNVISYGDDET